MASPTPSKSERVQTAIEVILLAVIAAFVSSVALIVFVDLFWTADPKSSEAFRGAFRGAFFAFISLRIGDALTAIDGRSTPMFAANNDAEWKPIANVLDIPLLNPLKPNDAPK